VSVSCSGQEGEITDYSSILAREEADYF
jgi:hypothetical protein